MAHNTHECPNQRSTCCRRSGVALLRGRGSAAQCEDCLRPGAWHTLSVSYYAGARAHLESCALDVACIDIGLPIESGYELCEYISASLGSSFSRSWCTSELGHPNTSHMRRRLESTHSPEAILNVRIGREHRGAAPDVWPSAAHVFQ